MYYQHHGHFSDAVRLGQGYARVRVRGCATVQKLDASSAKHENVQRELEAALEAQKLAHAEVHNRTSQFEQAQVGSCTAACTGQALHLT